MSTFRCRLSQPHVRDLLGVGAYVLALVAIGAVLYVGARAAAPAVLAGAMSRSQVLDRWTQPNGDEAHQPSNFQRWLADRQEAGGQQKTEPRAVVQQAVAPVASAPAVVGPVGVAAAARAKALAEIKSGRAAPTGAQPSRDEAALPPEARPAEQTGFRPPPPRDKHGVY